MTKQIFSDIEIIKKRLGKNNTTNWDDTFEHIAFAVRDFIVSQIGWDVQQQEHEELVDGHGEKPVILKAGNVTDLYEFSVWDGSEYNSITPLPRFFVNGMVDYDLPKGFKNAKVHYTAGYKIDFTGDHHNPESHHNLPCDISELSNRLISKIFLSKQEVGQKSVGFEGATTSWAEFLEPQDKATIKHYKRLWI